jgi:probable HAF family extracellular repeat protein
MKKTILAGLFNLLVTLSVSAIAFYDLGTLPGGTHSSGYDVSDVGNIAVGSVSMGSTSQAFRWTPSGGIFGLGYMPGYNSSIAYGTSGDGNVVVGYNVTSAGQAQAFRWTQTSGMTGLGYLSGGNYSSASAVSANGAIITGEANTPVGGRAFRWTQAGGMQNLGTLAGHNRSVGNGLSGDGSTIVGLSYLSVPGENSTDWQAFRWTQADGMIGLGWLPGYTMSQATAASTDGSVIVGMCGPFQSETAFRWTEDQGMMSLGLRYAYGVSGDGSIIVGSISQGAAIWDTVHGTREIKQLLVGEGININGWLFASAQDVSADGRVITGVGQYGSQLRAWMVIIPEPASATLLLLGLILLRARRQIRIAA